MYKSIAAYAAAMLEEKYIPTKDAETGQPVWGIAKDGKPLFSNLHAAHRVSILGSLRAGNDVIGGGSRAYNTVDKAVRHAIEVLYPEQDIYTIGHIEAIEVLLSVARG